MSTYQRTPSPKHDPNEEIAAAGADQQIKIDGFAQVVDMLRVADPSFRESILRRIAVRDPHLARSLRADLTNRPELYL